MKAFLLAAGEGRRLRPLTDTVPKCLVPIGGTPLLGIWLTLLARHGVSDVLVNVHHLHDRVRRFLATWPTPIRVEVVHEPRLLGSAGTVLANRDFVQRDQAFLIAYADNLTNADLGAIARFHAQRPEPMTIGVTPTDRPREKGTVVLGPAGEVVAFEEKAEHPRSNLANAGIYVTGQDVFDVLPSELPVDRVLDFGFDVLPRMVPRIAAYRITEFLTDIGTPQALAAAEREWPGLAPREESTVAS